MSATAFQRLHGWSALAGLAGFVWCALNHVCCGGHMEHTPYPWWHYALDGGWVAAFVVAAACGVVSRPSYLAAPLLLAALSASRLSTGSGSGFFLILEFPAVLGAAALALAAAVGPARPRHAELLSGPAGLNNHEDTAAG